ncbi:MAG: hypothetical protein FWC84_02845, partial [Alphaproteobacteria bacterium]|nr:hypothetical protein [Alphaproteobacteria bacterium]
MIIAFYIAAAFVMAGGSIYFAWRNRDFRKFLAGAFFVCRPPLYFISIYPMFRCLFWGQIFLRSQRSALHARSSISSSSCSVSILALSGGQRLKMRADTLVGLSRWPYRWVKADDGFQFQIFVESVNASLPSIARLL